MLTARLGSRYTEAVAYAIEAHGTQARKGTAIPYAAHFLSVSALVLEHGGDEDLAIAALLHDVVEDCGTAHIVAIEARFGTRVRDVVLSCTDSMDLPGHKAPWRSRKEQYLAHLPNATDDAALVSCCDKLHNARSLLTDLQRQGETVWGRFAGGKEGTLWYYAALAAFFRRRGTPPSAELHRTVQAIGAVLSPPA